MFDLFRLNVNIELSQNLTKRYKSKQNCKMENAKNVKIKQRSHDSHFGVCSKSF